ncbi:hypothetical protein MIND_01298700 [Mycena indigotica]|uniref:Uncharacterized protein n=1 Tax=Mycena indigotica TaxID=2126181 RepID=A0A8H6S0T3_9AGAR|nr:uncharacterized protein MIND_01298700 [Mycena indigotica]KAF7290586.1 hypothetical protein MIND_01298700 [Mycena indigotica]
MSGKYSGKSGIVIAIDIGTTSSAAAYCIKMPGEKLRLEVVNQWPMQVTSTLLFRDSVDVAQPNSDAKVKTAILYNHAGEMVAFGAETENDGDLQQERQGNLHRAEWFKLHFGPSTLRNHPVVKPLPHIPVTVDDMYKDALGYCVKQIENTVLQRSPRGRKQWEELSPQMTVVLTTPNGWMGAEQHRLRKAAVRAGLVPSSGEDRVLFLSEAEVAGIHFAIENGSLVKTDWLKPGSHLIVCDIGGGTVDTTRYTVISSRPSLKLKESSMPLCSMAGGSTVTMRARDWLQGQALKGTNWDNETEMSQLVERFDTKTKQMFTAGDMFLPLGGAATTKRIPRRGFTVEIDQGYLKIPNATMRSFFAPSLEQIEHDIDFATKNVEGQVIATNVLIVGRFGDSRYLYNELCAWGQQRGLNFTKPENMSSKGTVSGALRWALSPLVHERLAKFHYGTDIRIPFDQNNQEHRRRPESILQTQQGEVQILRAWGSIVEKGVDIPASQEFISSYVYELDARETQLVREEIIYIYTGHGHSTTPPLFLDLPSNQSAADRRPVLQRGVEVFCTIQADLTRCFRATPSHRTPSGALFKEVKVDVCLRLGSTEFQAWLQWLEDGNLQRGRATVVFN